MNITNKGKKYTTANGGNIWGLKGEFTNLDQKSWNFVLIKGIKQRNLGNVGATQLCQLKKRTRISGPSPSFYSV